MGEATYQLVQDFFHPQYVLMIPMCFEIVLPLHRLKVDRSISDDVITKGKDLTFF